MTDRDAFDRDGAMRVRQRLAVDQVEGLRAIADEHLGDRPGKRLDGEGLLTGLLSPHGTIGAIAAALTSKDARPVRAVLFDKSERANWRVDWHQDRTIPVVSRIEVEGFGPWSVKDGAPHVAPPTEMLAKMVTLRVHLDDVTDDNAPLKIVLGSHRLGRVAADAAAEIANARATRACLAEAGDVWAYRTLILHASDPSSEPLRRRRVLQIDYADFDLPGGLEWRAL